MAESYRSFQSFRVKCQVLRVHIYPFVIFASFLLIILSAIFAHNIAPHEPDHIDLANRLLPPAWVSGGATNYLFGTDNLGRDIYSRILFGGRISLAVGFLAVAIAGTIGITLGLIAGYFGGRVDSVIMRLTDAASSIPIILIALLFVITLGASFLNMVLALAALLWARYPRVIRSEVLSLKERDFVTLAKLAGVPDMRIIIRHILPNILHAAIVLLTLQLGVAIITEATLSFLGAGVPPPMPAWGGMVALGRDYVATAWWISFFPGMSIVITVLLFNLLGDWVRDRFDPRLRRM